ncbi:MAG: RNA pseudouridine synthase [Solobacterium sp.]|nr:RNA pseudouridine synthase [Solobacterium sp.]
MIEVLYEDNHLLCVRKPVNVPVQEDSSKDDDLLSMCKAYLKETYSKPGNVYLGLVHRLDRPVGGAMVFAKTSKAASRLSDSIRKGEITKEYTAILDGIIKPASGILKDYLKKDSRTNTSSVTDKDSGKYCELSYETIAVENGHSIVRILLATGRSHQIRVQFASRGVPLLNDQRYNKHAGKGQIALWATRLSFPHPTTRETVEVQCPPDNIRPWKEYEVFR